MDTLEAFVITNGRKTFDFVLRSIAEQSLSLKVTVIRDMKWVDALNKCVELCKSQYFLRIDDDMFLHKYAFAYYMSKANKLKNTDKVGVYVCRLWEEWSRKPINGLRMYSTKAAQDIGFRPSKLGKVDKVFRNSLRRIRMSEIKNASMVGVHALADRNDQIKYRDLWRDHNAKLSREKFAQTFDNIIHTMDISLERQYFLLSRIRKLNSKFHTEYVRFIHKQRDQES